MRIVIDMQPLQSSASKNRGVGRYTKIMVSLLCKQCQKDDEVFLALNGAYPESVIDISDYFSDFMPRNHIKVWHYYPEVPAAMDVALGNMPVNSATVNNYEMPQPEELFREWFLAQFDADIIWTPNFQEGWADKNIYTSARRTKGRAVICSTLYDVTPMIYPERYLNPWIEPWYYSKIAYSASCDYIFTVSEYSKKKIAELLCIPEEKVIRVYSTIEREKFFPDGDFANFQRKSGDIVYYGGLDPHKNVKALLDAYERLPQKVRLKHKLHVVGKAPSEMARKEMENAIARNPNSIEWTDYLSDEDLVKVLQRCSAFVYPSFSEGFGLPPLEAMSCGAPTLSSRASSLTEVIGSEEFSFDPFDIIELSGKLEKLLNDEDYFKRCIKNGTRQVARFSAEETGKALYRAFCRIAPEWRTEENYTRQQLINDLGVLGGTRDYNKVCLWAKSIYESTLFRKSKTIFFDLSSTVPMNYTTGIQRVAQNLSKVAKQLLCDNQETNVEVVYREPGSLTFYRALFDNNRWNVSKSQSNKDIVIPREGDTVVIADLNMGDIHTFRDYWHRLTCEGIKVYAILYDLIPVYFSEYCDPNVVYGFQFYIKALHYLSGVICDSECVANDYKKYCAQNDIELRKDFTVDYFHLGADLKNGTYSKGLPDDSADVIAAFKARPTFIMVSTIEPRKCQDEILAAVEKMWKQGTNINLCLVGRNGWLNDRLIKKLNTHKERGRRLFWLSDVSDEYLDLLYKESSAVIFASVSEGFGLSIVEGALHHKPLILRDIEVFREIAMDSAFYLHGKNAAELAVELEKWLELYAKGEAPNSEGVEVLTWKESTEVFLRKIGVTI